VTLTRPDVRRRHVLEKAEPPLFAWDKRCQYLERPCLVLAASSAQIHSKWHAQQATHAGGSPVTLGHGKLRSSGTLGCTDALVTQPAADAAGHSTPECTSQSQGARMCHRAA